MFRKLVLVHESEIRQKNESEYISSSISPFDAALSGLPRGAVTEIFGPPGSGKTSFFNQFLSHATTSGEFCALIDGSDSFDLESSGLAGADFRRLLWVRCRGIEASLKAADLLVHSGGWGAIVLDLAGLPSAAVRKVPMSWWYRFRRAVENTPTAFLVVETEPYVRNCALMALEFPPAEAIWSGEHEDFRLLAGTRIRIAPRKPVRAQSVTFQARWKGGR